MHNHCFQFLLGIEANGYAHYYYYFFLVAGGGGGGGVNKVHFGLCMCADWLKGND